MLTSPQLKKRSDLHLARKIWHFVGVIIVAIIYHNVPRALALELLTLISGLFIFFDILRQQSKRVNVIFMTLMAPVLRDNEKTHMTGATYMSVGILITVLFFPPAIVMISLLFLAVADPIASYFGIRYGKDRLFGRKSLQGTAAAFFACTLVAAGYFFVHNMMTERILIVAILAGIAGALSEAIPVGKLDDNLVLPVLSSVFLWVIFYLFGGF